MVSHLSQKFKRNWKNTAFLFPCGMQYLLKIRHRGDTITYHGKYYYPVRLRLSTVFILVIFLPIIRPHPFLKTLQKGMRPNCFHRIGRFELLTAHFYNNKRRPSKSEDFRGFGAAIQIRTGSRDPRNEFRGSLNDLGLKKCAHAHLGMRPPVLLCKKENHRIKDAVEFLGAATQIRTGDLILTKYILTVFCCFYLL